MYASTRLSEVRFQIFDGNVLRILGRIPINIRNGQCRCEIPSTLVEMALYWADLLIPWKSGEFPNPLIGLTIAPVHVVPEITIGVRRVRAARTGAIRVDVQTLNTFGCAQ